LRVERKLRVFENRVLRTIFGPQRKEITGELEQLHSEELRDFYFSPICIILVIKSRRLSWA
jgi:hypothetical protein